MTTPGFNKPAYLLGQFGTPIWGVAGSPLPFTGNYFFVDETNGSDGNTGGPSDAFKTLTQALANCTANNNDVVFMTGSVHVTATVAWNMSKTHLIGISPPSQNSRARIAISNTAATTGAVSPLVNVTGAGCWFQNIEGFNGINQAATQVTWAEAGGENYYLNCNFIQTGHATAAAQAGSRALTVGSDENLFVGCTIGGDTLVRATNTNAELEMIVNPGTGLGAARNIFRDCVFQAFVSDTADLHVLVGAGALDRYVLFHRCTFLNAINSTGATMAVAFTVNAAAGGSVLLQECASVGSTVYATSGPIYVMGSVPTGATSGLAVAAT